MRKQFSEDTWRDRSAEEVGRDRVTGKLSDDF